MATSIALVILLSLGANFIFERLRLPGLVGMLSVGMLLGPYGLNVLDPQLLAVSGDLRRIALVVILLRAGLMLNAASLRRLGRPVALMSWGPSLAEGAVVALAAPWLLGLGRGDAIVLGAVVSAVSPAVVVPAMIGFIARGRGTRRGVPTLLLAASPLDNVLVIVVFSHLLALQLGHGGSLGLHLAALPVSVALGAGVGVLLGKRLYRVFVRFDPRATKRVLIVMGVALLLVAAEEQLQDTVPFSGLMAVMIMALTIVGKSEGVAHEISSKLSKIWIAAEILLFVLVGAMVDPALVVRAGLAGAALIALGLIARSIAVWLCLLRTQFTTGERLFCVAAYLPKATVQAAIGATPLAAGLPGGALMLAVAVLTVILTSPLGAVLTRGAGERLLTNDGVPEPAADMEADRAPGGQTDG